MPNVVLRAINDRHRSFWQIQNDLLMKRVSNKLTFDLAMQDMEFEVRRGIPLRFRKTLEKALEDAEKAQIQFQTAFSKKGGKAEKADVLTKFIYRKLVRYPALTVVELCNLLREDHDFEFEHGVICFLGANGQEKHVSVSSLKDRLSRARKKLQSR